MPNPMPTDLFFTPPPTLAAANPLDHVVSHALFYVGPLAVTNHLLMGIVTAVLVLVAFFGLRSKMSPDRRLDGIDGYVVKGRFWQILETMCVFIREQVARPNLGPLTDKYIPYLWSTFFFILFANLLGLLPFGSTAGLGAWLLGSEHATTWWAHLGGTATGTIAMTVPLAIVAFLAINFIGVRESGVGYFKHFCPVEITSPGMIPLAVMLVPLEVMGLIIKCSVLAMRLFGTMMAGHLVLAVFVGMIALAAGASAVLGGGVGVAVVLLGGALLILELFIAMLQAFIFTFLTTLFIAAGAVHHDHDHAHHHDGAELDPAMEPHAPTGVGLHAAAEAVQHPQHAPAHA